MTTHLFRLFLLFVLLGTVACGGSDVQKPPQEKPPTAKPDKPPGPPKPPKGPPKDTVAPKAP